MFTEKVNTVYLFQKKIPSTFIEIVTDRLIYTQMLIRGKPIKKTTLEIAIRRHSYEESLLKRQTYEESLLKRPPWKLLLTKAETATYLNLFTEMTH